MHEDLNRRLKQVLAREWGVAVAEVVSDLPRQDGLAAPSAHSGLPGGLVEEAAVDPVGPPDVLLHRLGRCQPPRAEAAVVLVASDWHVEENVDPAKVSYLNEFNIDIAKSRAETFFRAGLL